MEITKLYGGKVSLEFNEAKHTYTVDGQIVDGVTGVLSVIAKPALIAWAANMAAEHIIAALKPGQVMDEMSIKGLANDAKAAHRKKKEQAADVGSFVHEWIENYIKTGGEQKHIEHPEIKNGVAAFMEWVNAHSVQFVASEGKIYSQKHGYAGTFDFIATVDGKHYLGDIKTSSGVYPEHFLQTTAYQMARQEEHPDEHYDGHIIVNCKKDGTLDTVFSEPDDFARNQAAFLSALGLYRWQKAQKEFNKK